MFDRFGGLPHQTVEHERGRARPESQNIAFRFQCLLSVICFVHVQVVSMCVASTGEFTTP